jgi:hypothetical protein
MQRYNTAHYEDITGSMHTHETADGYLGQRRSACEQEVKCSACCLLSLRVLVAELQAVLQTHSRPENTA